LYGRDPSGAGPSGAGPSGGTHLVVYAGNLVPVKQVDRLLRAVAALGKRDGVPPVALAIVGEGEEEQRLRALAGELGIAGMTLFAGRRPHDEIPLWLAAADLVVLPSKSEGMPLVIPEALASGTPVVASRVGGVPDCLEDQVTGILVDAEGVPGLAVALSAGLQRTWDREELAAAARPFGWDGIIDRIEALYHRQLAAAPIHP
jgi:glycosyltransferase involved in cell wall biosynthesis